MDKENHDDHDPDLDDQEEEPHQADDVLASLPEIELEIKALLLDPVRVKKLTGTHSSRAPSGST